MKYIIILTMLFASTFATATDYSNRNQVFCSMGSITVSYAVTQIQTKGNTYLLERAINLKSKVYHVEVSVPVSNCIVYWRQS